MTEIIKTPKFKDDAQPFITAYSQKTVVEIRFDDPSLTQQHMLEDTDINNIVKKFEATGLIDHVNENPGMYTDLTLQPVDYQTALNIVIDARTAFDALPADLRLKFNNDPKALVAFIDKASRDELEELGLVPPLPQEPLPPKTKIEASDEADKKA